MKRLNRKQLIDDFEWLRQGFKEALNFLPLSDVERVSFDAKYRYADQCVVQLGGKSVFGTKKRDSIVS